MSGFDQVCLEGESLSVHNGISLEECCALTAKKHLLPQAFSYHHNNQSCELKLFNFKFQPCPDGVSGFPDPSSSSNHTTCNCSRVHQTVGRQNLTSAYSGKGGKKYGPGYKGGLWYSNPAAGECKEGQKVGDDGCTWRIVDTQKVLKASCMYTNIDDHVEASDTACFSACQQPKNVTSSCYLKCYSEATEMLTNDEIVTPWTKAFASNNVAEGGCPSVNISKLEGFRYPY